MEKTVLREILFRGMDRNGLWHYGFPMLAEQEQKYYIGVSEILHPVNPETISQFTGLLDRKGKKIFEGDFDTEGNVVTWCENRNGWSFSIYDFSTKDHIECHCYNCAGNFDINECLSDFKIKGNIYD